MNPLISLVTSFLLVFYFTENNFCGSTVTSVNVTLSNGIENSIECFELPNNNDTTFTLFLSSEDTSITYGNQFAAVTIERRLHNYNYSQCMAFC